MKINPVTLKKARLLPLALILPGMASCDPYGEYLVGLEANISVPATVMSANTPTSTTITASFPVGGGSTGTIVTPTTTIITQHVTVRRHDNNTLAAGKITLDSTNDRLNSGNTGYALIGQRSGELRGFEKTSD